MGPSRATTDGRGVVDTFLYPGERPLAATHLVETMAVSYPPLDLIVFGVRIDWLVAFLLFSLAFGFVTRASSE